MSAVDDLLEANDRYAAGFAKGDLPMPPGRKVAILACMDARLDPARALGLEEGDAVNTFESDIYEKDMENEEPEEFPSLSKDAWIFMLQTI